MLIRSIRLRNLDSRRRALEEGLESFGGCAVVSSHDRWFLDRIATHILAFEGNCVFRPIPATDSDASRPPIPTEPGH